MTFPARGLLISTSALIVMFACNARAQAACGQIQLEVVVHRLQSLEASPLTLSRVYSGVTGTPSRDAGEYSAQYHFQTCPEDPSSVSQPQLTIWRFWIEGVDLQNRIAVYRFIQSGALKAPKACLPAYLAELKDTAYGRWHQAMRMPTAEAAALTGNGLFGPLHAFWKQLTGDIGVALEEPGSNIDDALMMQYSNARVSAYAHLP